MWIGEYGVLKFFSKLWKESSVSYYFILFQQIYVVNSNTKFIIYAKYTHKRYIIKDNYIYIYMNT